METALNQPPDPVPSHLPAEFHEAPAAAEGEDATPPLQGAVVVEDQPAGGPGRVGNSALVKAHTIRAGERQERRLAELPEHLQQIQFRLELCVAVPKFTLRQLRDLAPNALLITEHSSTRELTLTTAGERLLLVELEAVELQLAARVKRLL